MGGTETGIKSTKSGIITESIGLIPSEFKGNIVMVGDYTGDIKVSKDNKIDSVAVTYGFGKEQDQLETGPTYVANSVRDLRNILIGL